MRVDSDESCVLRCVEQFLGLSMTLAIVRIAEVQGSWVRGGTTGGNTRRVWDMGCEFRWRSKPTRVSLMASDDVVFLVV